MSSAEKFVFSNEWRHRIARHVAFWSAWLLFHGLIYGSFWRGGGSHAFGDTFASALLHSYFISFTEALLFMPVHLFLSYSIIYYLLPKFLFTKQYVKLIVGFALLLVVTAVLSHLTAITAIRQFRESLGLQGGASTFLFGLMAGLRGSNTVAGFATAIKLIKYWYLKSEENQKLEKIKLNAELQVLRNQLQPHFLFNTLNGLYSLTLQNSARAPEMVIRLSELLRYMLTECNKPFVNLSTELALLNNYIELEKIRFGDRLTISMHVQGDTQMSKINPLLLLPFLENSFKHGVHSLLDEVWVSISIEMDENNLSFKLINSKPEKKSAITSMGIGLHNIRKRLELIYPGKHLLKITETNDTYIANLWLALEKDEEIATRIKSLELEAV